MMRIFALLGCLLLSIKVVLANSAIILISPSAAGPQVQTETYSHPIWITWPKAIDGSGTNQLISIVTRNANIPVGETNFVFRTRPYGQFWNSATETLGRYELPNSSWVSQDLVALQLGGTGVDKGVLAMASCSFPLLRVRSSIVPQDHLIYLARAMSWDEVAKVSRQIDRDVLVVEFPPREGHRYSRLWTFREGSLKPTSKTGVIESKDLMELIDPVWLKDVDLIRDPGKSLRSGSPDRWLAIGELATSFRASLFVLAWLAVFVSLGYLSREVSRTSSRVAFYAFLSLFLSYRLLPALLPWSGVQLWWFWLSLATALLTSGFVALDLNAKEESRPPVVILGLPMLLLTSYLNQNASPFGPVYSMESGLSPENVAFELVFGAYFFISERGKSGLLWLMACVALPLIALKAYLFDAGYLALYAITLLCFLMPGLLARIIAILLTAFGALRGILTSDEIVWRAYDPVSFRSRTTENYFELARQIIHPEFGVVILAVIAATVFASKFGHHRLVRAWRELPIVKPIFGIALFVLLWTLGNPGMLGVMPWATTFAYLLWSQESLASL